MKLYQGMICLAGNQVWWTWEVEDVFHKAKKGGKTAMKVCVNRYIDYHPPQNNKKMHEALRATASTSPYSLVLLRIQLLLKQFIILHGA